MISDENVLRAHRERIELHKRNFQDRNYRTTIENSEVNTPFVFQSIICMFIFACLLILKLTNLSFTNNLITELDNHLTKDSLPQIIEFANNINNYDSLLDDLNANISNEVLDIEKDITYPATEFTIDENMISDINDYELVEKK